MIKLGKLSLLLFAAALALSAYGQAAPASPPAADAAQAAVRNPEDLALEQQLRQGIGLLQSGRPAQAITDHFDKVIAAFELRFKDDTRKFYTGRWQIDTLMYLVEAAASKEEPKRGAVVVPSLWSDAWYLKGYALVELRRISEAKSALESALALSPRNSQYLGELGNLYLGLRDWPSAFATFEKAAAAAGEFSPPEVKNAELSRAWRGMGYVYIEQNRLDEAEKMYLQCLGLDKNDQRARGQLSYIADVRSKRLSAPGDGSPLPSLPK
ncbi:tetratricopeptide repeat protein [Polaromonas sp.]|uniref:tetratricopeptide repeat protein n=1 Tax=Polaromonas sp. TaxID=1869339 RepID=UPI003265305B